MLSLENISSCIVEEKTLRPYWLSSDLLCHMEEEASAPLRRIGYDLVGTLSYLTPSEHTVRVENGLSVKIQCISEDVARVFFVDAAADEQRIPDGYVFQDLTTGGLVARYDNAWLISWTGSYEMKLGDELMLSIQNQREQVVLETFIDPNECVKKETVLPYGNEPYLPDKMRAGSVEEPDIPCLQRTTGCVDSNGDRAATLLSTVEQHKQAVIDLLGYTPDFSCRAVSLYSLLPRNCMPRAAFLERVALLTDFKAKHEAQLKEVQDKISLARNFGTEYTNGSDLARSVQRDIDASKSELLVHMLGQQPVDERAFRDKLAPHLDAMLDALCELNVLGDVC